ncbi:hypothetical protein ILYODFUR_003956 [Ilyodon furcidens]|uniref:Uncharacterized protein n=1 Tax=Ilyodon furcidens TaxID=33524 RepID=A0ABV0SLK2_9TELE
MFAWINLISRFIPERAHCSRVHQLNASAERAAHRGLVRASFVFLLLSATVLFTLTHRNSCPVSMTFVSDLPSVDTRTHCSHWHVMLQLSHLSFIIQFKQENYFESEIIPWGSNNIFDTFLMILHFFPVITKKVSLLYFI